MSGRKVGAWSTRIRRANVRAFNDTLWLWSFEHDAAGVLASGFERTESAAETRAEQELAKWLNRRFPRRA